MKTNMKTFPNRIDYIKAGKDSKWDVAVDDWIKNFEAELKEKLEYYEAQEKWHSDNYSKAMIDCLKAVLGVKSE